MRACYLRLVRSNDSNTGQGNSWMHFRSLFAYRRGKPYAPKALESQPKRTKNDNTAEVLAYHAAANDQATRPRDFMWHSESGTWPEVKNNYVSFDLGSEAVPVDEVRLVQRLDGWGDHNRIQGCTVQLLDASLNIVWNSQPIANRDTEFRWKVTTDVGSIGAPPSAFDGPITDNFNFSEQNFGQGYIYLVMIAGWQRFGPFSDGDSGTVLIKNGQAPWGGLTSTHGDKFLGLQTAGVGVEQTVRNLTPGMAYQVVIATAGRPQNNPYNITPSFRMEVADLQGTWDAPMGQWRYYKESFMATSTSHNLKITNNSRTTGHTVFLAWVGVYKYGTHY